MKNKTFLYFLFLSASVVFTNCTTPTFLPQSHNVPLFTDKKQLHISSSANIRTFDFQAAYAPVKHLGIITDIQFTSHYTMAEIGMGAFQSFGKNLVTEVYVGYGNGNLNTDVQIKTTYLSYDYNRYNINIHANKYFIQPNIGIKFNDKINLAFSTKCIFWQYSNYQYYHEKWIYDDGGYFLTGSDSLSSKNSSAITIEPALTFRVGGKHTKFMLQTGLCPILSSGGVQFAPYRNTYTFIRLGVCLNFELFAGKKDE